MSLRVSTAPHLHSAETVQTIMLDVIIALLPASIAGVYFFGYKALILILASIASAVLAEFVWQKLAKKAVTIFDLSAVVTGLLLALNLPSTAPWWIAVLGSFIAIILVKQIFGGIGHNFLNPALASRAVLLASFPALMTSFVMPTYTFMQVDAVSSPTVLSGELNIGLKEMFFGYMPGTIGEVCKLAILLGLAYLLIMRVIKWQIPVIFLATTALCCYLFSLGSGSLVNPLEAICSGGVMFGAVFMATDYATNPMTTKGKVVFAIGCGLLVAIIRTFGSYPEGVTYAILLMNILTPLIDKYMKPKIYGEVKQNA